MDVSYIKFYKQRLQKWQSRMWNSLHLKNYLSKAMFFHYFPETQEGCFLLLHWPHLIHLITFFFSTYPLQVTEQYIPTSPFILFLVSFNSFFMFDFPNINSRSRTNWIDLNVKGIYLLPEILIWSKWVAYSLLKYTEMHYIMRNECGTRMGKYCSDRH